MSRKRILILGAGLAGLSAAWHLQKRDVDCRVFEKETEVGGLCRSKAINGFTFDYDGHLLHFKHSHTFDFIKKLFKNQLVKHKRSAWVYAHGRYLHYPFQANLNSLPAPVIKECLREFILTLENGRPNGKPRNFLEWINRSFGKGIARHFMVPYNHKFWTVHPKELTCEWLDGFIPVPSPGQIIAGAIEEGNNSFGYNAHFWYPRQGGIHQLPLFLAEGVRNIYTNFKITEIDLKEKEIKTCCGRKEKFDYLISTIPLPEMAHIIRGLPKNTCNFFKKLRWNSIFNLNLGIDSKDSSGRHWIYFPQKGLSFFRAGFFHNFSRSLAPSRKSSLYVEVAYSRERPIDKNNIVLRIKRDLKKAGILTAKDRVCAQDINDIEYGYPIYDVNYSEARTEILKYLSSKNVISCGRYGSWRYLSMEDAILDGKKAAMHL